MLRLEYRSADQRGDIYRENHENDDFITSKALLEVDVGRYKHHSND